MDLFWLVGPINCVCVFLQHPNKSNMDDFAMESVGQYDEPEVRAVNSF